MKSTSWQPAAKWYQENVGEEGHYYHQNVILPNLIKLLPKNGSLLDLACGQGILARKIAPTLDYQGLDIAPSLIKFAKSQDKNPAHQFLVQDVTKPFDLKKKFTVAACILAIQNIDPLAPFLENAYTHLEPNSPFFIVLNHPCFRIPRQSSWEIDESKKIQYRRVDRYMSPLEIPIKTHPGKEKSASETLSFHRPLSTFIQELAKAGFIIENIDEWISDKVSTGAKAKMENRAREEFPLFMLITAKKLS